MSTETEIRQLPPITCQPWCEDGDGHPNEIFPEDQWCMSAEQTVQVSHYPSFKGPDGVFAPEEVTVYASQHQVAAGTVTVSLGGADTLLLSPAEARAIAAAMIASADLADGGA